jgi:hypothetical protein
MAALGVMDGPNQATVVPPPAARSALKSSPCLRAAVRPPIRPADPPWQLRLDAGLADPACSLPKETAPDRHCGERMDVPVADAMEG